MTARCKCCGQPTKVRSTAEHNHAFALVAAAFAHWPEAHEFQPESAEHLRHWLTCKAGHVNVKTLDTEFCDEQPAVAKLTAIAIEGALAAAKSSAFVRVRGDKIAIFTPKSWKVKLCKTSQFRDLHSAIAEIIETEIGVPADKLMKEHERAA